MQKHYNLTKIRTTLRNVLKGRNIEDSFCLRHQSVQNLIQALNSLTSTFLN